MKKKGVTLPLICTLLICIIVISTFINGDKDTPINVEYSAKGNSVVLPVLFFEENIGQLDYLTRTFVLKNNKTDEIEPHYRSFSKTYPISALEKLNNAAETYGQLLAYYKTSNDSIYIFDNSTAKDKKKYLLYYQMEMKII
jgi:hypothetical protein